MVMPLIRNAALAVLVAGASTVPLSDASARCWHCGGPPFFLWPFAAAGAIVAGAATIATAPIAAVAGAPYYGPGYGGGYGPGYYAPPPAYYYPPQAYYGAQPYYYGPRGYWAQGGAQ
jgi:hypothetical protein